MKTILLIFLAEFLIFSTGKLIAVYQVGRHGARSPDRSYPGILQNDSDNFIKNRMQLTHLGLLETFERGVKVKEKYISQFDNFSGHLIQVRASNTNRTILSAYSQLLGMFGSEQGKENFVKEVELERTKEIDNISELSPETQECLSEFIPVVIVHEKADSTFQIKDNNCPLLQNMYQEGISKDEEIGKTFLNLESKISSWSTLHYPFISKDDYSIFCGYLVGAEHHELLANSALFNSSKISGDILDSGTDYKYTEVKTVTARTPLFTKFFSTNLVKDILRAFDDAIDDYDSNRITSPLFYFDSCHDTNIYPLMVVLGIDYGTVIPFSGSLYFELHDDDMNNKKFVKVLMNEEELDIDFMSHYQEDQEISHDKIRKRDKDFGKNYEDEADKDSSVYYYLKRYLLRKIFSENIESYGNKTLQELMLFEVNPDKQSLSNKPLFILAIVLASVAVFGIIVIIGLGFALRLRKIEEFTHELPTPTARSMAGEHHKFDDEEEIVVQI